MSMEYDEQQVNRRGFLRGVAATALAATAAGAGAATLIKNAPLETTVAVVSKPAATSVQTPALSAAEVAVPAHIENPTEALSQIADLQADNLRLQAALTAAQQQIESLQQSGSATTTQTEALTIELNDANHRLNLLTGLLALYEQLDEIEFNTIFENGVTAVSTAITDLIDDLPSLEAGLQAGEAALNTFEAQIPLVQNGRSWLQDQTAKLQLYFTAIEKILEKAVDQVSPFFDMLHDWFQDVQKWLPFGIGQRAVEVMDAITVLLIETPQTISGVQTNLHEPLSQWLSEETDTLPIHQNLVLPLRHDVLLKANTTTGKAKQVETVYRNQLVEATKTAVEQQQALQQLITQYREQHNL